jgi:hypothetical protein
MAPYPAWQSVAGPGAPLIRGFRMDGNVESRLSLTIWCFRLSRFGADVRDDGGFENNQTPEGGAAVSPRWSEAEFWVGVLNEASRLQPAAGCCPCGTWTLSNTLPSTPLRYVLGIDYSALRAQFARHSIYGCCPTPSLIRGSRMSGRLRPNMRSGFPPEALSWRRTVPQSTAAAFP